MGRRTHWDTESWLPTVSASSCREPVHRSIPKEMEDWDIARVVADFAAAAHRCQLGGLDGLELSAMSGHLIIEEIEERAIDQVVVECGTVPNEALYFELKESSANRGEIDLRAFAAALPQPSCPTGQFALFRIGDAVTSRNVHAALLDAMRLCKSL